MDPGPDGNDDEVDREDSADDPVVRKSADTSEDTSDDGPFDEYEAPVQMESGPGDVIESARRRYGTMGAALGAGMFGLDQALTGKQKPETVQIQEAPSDPVDVDKDGIQLMIDELTSVNAPALERRVPVGLHKKKSRRR